ncbi:MAG: ABC transporter ATP-binding protein [Deinococcota bacterium]
MMSSDTTKDATAPLLVVEDLKVDFHTRAGPVQAVRGPSFSVRQGEALGLVGESGCGKSVTASAILGMVELPGEIVSGDIRWKGKSLLGRGAAEYRRQVCGHDIAIVFQDPMTSFDPLFSVGYQITEVLKRHSGLQGAAARRRAIELLDKVKLTNPEKRVDQFPHELSGGMRQRALIAMSLASEPELLIADEPTTALDVTVQAAILALLTDLQQELGIAVLFITHDLGVVARFCHHVAVMYQGDIVELGRVEQVLRQPQHAYSAGLVACQPSLKSVSSRLMTIGDTAVSAQNVEVATNKVIAGKVTAGKVIAGKVVTDAESLPVAHLKVKDAALTSQHISASVPPASVPIVEVNNLSVDFTLPRTNIFAKRLVFQAVKNVSFYIQPGETLGLVGESGSGKTTTGRAVLQSQRIASGQVIFKGNDITGTRGEALRQLRRDMQLIFQDPYSSLNPRMSVLEIISEPLIVHNIETNPKVLRDKTVHLLETVGMPADSADRYPHSFSGGQRQRIGIARALALEPSFIVADEPVSALDVSVRAQVVNLMQDLQEKIGLSFLFIAHDLAIVRHIAHRVAIMNKGEIVELGTREQIYDNPQEDYTKELLAAVPEVDDYENYRESYRAPSPL